MRAYFNLDSYEIRYRGQISDSRGALDHGSLAPREGRVAQGGSAHGRLADTLDYDRLARVVAGLEAVVADLTGTAHCGPVGEGPA